MLTRIWTHDEWYVRSDVNVMYESSYEGLLLANSEVLFPDRLCSEFKVLATSTLGSVIPDLVLVDPVYRSWCVVEVELASHSFNGHIRPQIERLVEARFGDAHADWLGEHDGRFDVARLRSLFRSQAPSVMAIVNRSVPQWENTLRAMGCLVSVVEVFRNRLNQVALAVSGDELPSHREILSVVEHGSGWFRRFLRVSNPAPLGVSAGSPIQIRFDGVDSVWAVAQFGDDVYLCPAPAMRVPETGRLAIVRSDFATFELVQEGVRR
jgi:hypothetical protein